MDAIAESDPPALRHTWVFAAAFLGAAMLGAVGIAVYWAGPGAGVVTAAAFVLPLLYAVPGGRGWWIHHRARLLTTQALLTYGPFLLFGGQWIAGLPGLLCGLLLLTVAAPIGWLLFGAALAAEVALRLAVVGLPYLPGVSEATLVVVVPVYACVALFGLVRLDGLVTGLHAARAELATLTVARERVRAADRLRAAIGARLQTVAARARAALVALAEVPDEAREQLVDAAGHARQALAQVRVTVAEDVRGAGMDVSAPPSLAPRLARQVLVLLLVVLSGQSVIDAVAGHAGPSGAAVATASVTAIVALAGLQLYHSTAWREGARPRGWTWTLAAQLLLTGLGFLPVLHPAIHGLGGFVAGSVLLLLPSRWGWLAFSGIQAAIAVHVLILPGLNAADFAYSTLVTVTTGLVVYGLSRLAGLAAQLDQTRRELARMAGVRERLRVARDTHDLLGMGLSAIALKCDLARRLIGRDDARASQEIGAVVRLAARARVEMRAVTADQHRLTLSAALDEAAEVLTAAGVVAVVHADRSAPLPADVDPVLAAVLREAVTNVLRHATAQRCEIDLTVEDAAACLAVTNDGVPTSADRTPHQPEGHGLANLAARAAGVGGQMSTRTHGDRFVLTVRIPSRRSARIP